MSMCLANMGSGTAKLLDPGGAIVSQVVPKWASPFAGLSGTVEAMKGMQPKVAEAPAPAPLAIPQSAVKQQAAKAYAGGTALATLDPDEKGLLAA